MRVCAVSELIFLLCVCVCVYALTPTEPVFDWAVASIATDPGIQVIRGEVNFFLQLLFHRHCQKLFIARKFILIFLLLA